MATVTCEIVEQDGGWAYKVGDVYSETFPTHDEAVIAACGAVQVQERLEKTTDNSGEDEQGRSHDEIARGDDRTTPRAES